MKSKITVKNQVSLSVLAAHDGELLFYRFFFDESQFLSSGSIVVFLTAKTAPATVAAVDNAMRPLADSVFSHETILRIYL